MSDSLLGILPGTTGAVDPTSAYPIAGDAGLVAGTGTGQHGVLPITNGGNGGGGMMSAIQAAWDWLNRPFSQPMSPIGIFEILVWASIAWALWIFLAYHIRIAAEAI